MFFELSFIFLSAGLIIDFVSCVLNSRRLIKRNGMSGIPIIPLVIYLLVFLWDEDLIIFSKFFDIIFFIGVHVLLQYGIPLCLKNFFSVRRL